MTPYPQTPPSGQIDPQFFIAKYLSPILQYKWLVLLSTILGLAIAIPASMLVQPEYSSIATTQLETPRAQMISKVTEEISSRTGDKNYITAAVERMHSSAFQTEVLKILPKRLIKDLETPLGVIPQMKAKLIPYLRTLLGKSAPPQNDQGKITPQHLDKLSKRITIKGKPAKGIVQITGVTFAQDMATVLVQSYLDIWVALNMETNKSLIRHELGFTRTQKDEYFALLKSSEKELRLFKQKFEIPPALSSVTDMELQSQLDVLQNKVLNAKERYKRIDDIYLDLVRKEKAVVNNIKVINPPQTPLEPSKNIRMLIILFGLVAGAIAAIAPILIIDYYRGNIRHRNDISSAVDIPIIGTLPTIK
jgi:uncharacterized protein involved in exopolysaccharide biosynthesis